MDKPEHSDTLKKREPGHLDRVHVTVTEQLDEADSRALWTMIKEGFVELNRRSYEQQDMSREEFDADIASPDVLKCVARDETDKPLGVLLLHRGFDAITWTDTGEFSDLQREVDPEATPYYINSVVVPQDLRGTGVAAELIRGAGRYFAKTIADTGRQSLCFFDCAEANYPWLAKFSAEALESLADEGIGATIIEIHDAAWVRYPDGAVEKVIGQFGSDAEVVDRQYFYAINVGVEAT